MSGAPIHPSLLFDRDATGYDAGRRALVPCFDAFYGTALDVIHRWYPGGALRTLDLGAGTGLLAGMIRERFPDASLHLIDGSSAMLDQARQRLGTTSDVTFQVADMATVAIDGPWDLVVSALAIHHLKDVAKQRLFARIRASLAPGGLFVNAEQVLGPTPDAEAGYASRWLDDVRSAGLPDDEVERAAERMRYDRCATMEDQLAWMRQAGLVDVDCSFKSWRFAVLSGLRPRGPTSGAET